MRLVLVNLNNSRLNTNPKRQQGWDNALSRWRFGLVCRRLIEHAPASFSPGSQILTKNFGKIHEFGCRTTVACDRTAWLPVVDVRTPANWL
jgi:hypothetical protein